MSNPSSNDTNQPSMSSIHISGDTGPSRYIKGELLGRGACKTVYKAFDEQLGMEVAWNEISIDAAALQGMDEKQRERVFGEIKLLKHLKHKNILPLHDWWIDQKASILVFITELFIDGSLRAYRRRHKNVDASVIKRWAWQILQGLVYLHGHQPAPIIHRDLKCDNIFVNGSSGTLKIGDLGFATFRQGGLSAAMSVIGTPEFMAPELYDEKYDEKVDVYSFGMCLLELVTLEYPYNECRNAAQIYRKVTKGETPESLNKVVDPELKSFILLCIQHDPTQRPTARELVKHPFFDSVRHMFDPIRNKPPPIAAAAGSAGLPPSGFASPSTGHGARTPTLVGVEVGLGGLGIARMTGSRPGSASGTDDARSVNNSTSQVAIKDLGGSVHGGFAPLQSHMSPVVHRSESHGDMLVAGSPYGAHSAASSFAAPVTETLAAAAAALRPEAYRQQQDISSSQLPKLSQPLTLQDVGIALGVSVPSPRPPASPGAMSGFSSGPYQRSNSVTLACLPDAQAKVKPITQVGDMDSHGNAPSGMAASFQDSHVQPGSSGGFGGLATWQPSRGSEVPQQISDMQRIVSSLTAGGPTRTPSTIADSVLALAQARASEPGDLAALLLGGASQARQSGGGAIQTGPNAPARTSIGFDVPRQHAAAMPAPQLDNHASNGEGDYTEDAILYGQDDSDLSARNSACQVARAGSSPVCSGLSPGSGRLERQKDYANAEDDSDDEGDSFAQSSNVSLGQRVRLLCRNHQDNLLSFSMSFINHNGTRKKIGFQYDVDMDTAAEVAGEMIENLSLDQDEAGYIATLIQKELSRFRSPTPHPPKPAAILPPQNTLQQQLQQQQQGAGQGADTPTDQVGAGDVQVSPFAPAPQVNGSHGTSQSQPVNMQATPSTGQQTHIATHAQQQQPGKQSGTFATVSGNSRPTSMSGAIPIGSTGSATLAGSFTQVGFQEPQKQQQQQPNLMLSASGGGSDHDPRRLSSSGAANTGQLQHAALHRVSQGGVVHSASQPSMSALTQGLHGRSPRESAASHVLGDEPMPGGSGLPASHVQQQQHEPQIAGLPHGIHAVRLHHTTLHGHHSTSAMNLARHGNAATTSGGHLLHHDHPVTGNGHPHAQPGNSFSTSPASSGMIAMNSGSHTHVVGPVRGTNVLSRLSHTGVGAVDEPGVEADAEEDDEEPSCFF